MKTRKMIFTFLTILLVCSCKNNSQAKIEISNLSKDTTSLIVEMQKMEDFQSFLTNFQHDSVFQINRVKFPIKYYIYESGSYMDNSGNVIDLHNREVIINKDDWEYQNFVEYKKIISKTNENEYNLELQIEDTGVSVNYIFKINNNQWYLVEIVDESI
ncbi:MAG: hypothetical protein LBR97_02790 [Dysgonamonadaceae bacterium]|jgi:hypothetical protein|nr:hypothetical protein [Dysgonamonadaceae bacterium]